MSVRSEHALTYTLLEQYRPSDAQEIVARTSMLEFLQEFPDCFERSCVPGHFTGSAWLVNRSGDHVLLMHHRKLDKWLQPGGHADGDPDLCSVALKEANEETGLRNIKAASNSIFDLDIHLIPESRGVAAHLHYDVRFLLRAQDDQALLSNEESNQLLWVPLQELTQYTSEESLLRMQRKWLERNRSL